LLFTPVRSPESNGISESFVKHVQVRKEARSKPTKGGWTLCLQLVRYVFEGGKTEDGYRFIWRRANGNLQAARGQARLPSLKVVRSLMAQAEDQGWGGHDCGEGYNFPSEEIEEAA
jgi:hypothetical protein